LSVMYSDLRAQFVPGSFLVAVAIDVLVAAVAVACQLVPYIRFAATLSAPCPP